MSLGWSDDGPPLTLGRAFGWSDDGPTDPAPEPILGWTPEHWAGPLALAGEGLLVARGWADVHAAAQLAGAGALTAVDGYGRVHGAGHLSGVGAATVPGGWAEIYGDSDTLGAGHLAATGAVAVRGPQIYTGPGAWARPWWARWLDYTLLGPGGGGAGGRSSIGGDGRGGGPGTWISGTIDLGATWTAGTVTVAHGTPGPGGAISNQNGGTGTATTLTSPFGNRSAAGGPGGTGVNPAFGTDYRGTGPGNYDAFGVTHPGGGDVDKDTNGAPNGGGGGGGSGGYFPIPAAKAGRPGAAAYSWIRFRQN
ncbi:hypothetical protein [Tsukamurella sp. NPDC003166]|uniref:glycine-rich domain-containing protein n=1 Tax=Tsukamurella sp. NPDC003166 TaxID=3154444 RepID=UPI0033AF688A